MGDADKKGAPAGPSMLRRCCSAIAIILGLVLAIVGIALGLVLIPTTVKAVLETPMKICSETDDAYTSFAVPTRTGLVAAYYFNITNKAGVLSPTNPELPIVKEVGPFYYNTTTVRANVTLDRTANTIMYQEASLYNYSATPDFASFPEAMPKPFGGMDSEIMITNTNPLYAGILNKFAALEGETTLLKLMFAGTSLLTLDTGVTTLMNQLNQASTLGPVLAATRPALYAFPLSLVVCLETLDPRKIAPCLEGARNITIAAQTLGAYLQPANYPFSNFASMVTTAYTTIAQTYGAMRTASGPFVGIIADRTVKEWSFGWPSFVGGALYTSFWADPSKCNLTAIPAPCAIRDATCKTCLSTGNATVCATCGDISSLCGTCDVVARAFSPPSQQMMCGRLQQRFARILTGAGHPAPAVAAEALTNNTCSQCNLAGGFKNCLFPMKGMLSQTTYDVSEMSDTFFFKNIYNNANLDFVTVGSGCTNISDHMQTKAVNSQTQLPVWLKGNPQSQNPTALNLTSWNPVFVDCNKQTAPYLNVACARVSGRISPRADPAGANANGLLVDTSLSPDKLTFYAKPLKREVVLQRNGDYTVANIKMAAYKASGALLSWSSAPDSGLGVPLDGSLQLSYDTGLLFYITLPYLLNADAQYYTRTAQMLDGAGNQMTAASVASNENKYGIFVAVEPATGVVMKANVRTMISLAISPLLSNQTAGLSTVFAPSFPPEYLVPFLWSESGGMIGNADADKFTMSAKGAAMFFPIMVVMIIVGILTLALGCFCCCKKQKVQTA